MKGASPSGLRTKMGSVHGGPTFSVLAGRWLFLLWVVVGMTMGPSIQIMTLMVQVESLGLPSIPNQRHRSHHNNKKDNHNDIQYEVIGGSGRIGSQFLRLLAPRAVALPRGVCPGSLTTSTTTNSNCSYNNPILICTPASAWKDLYEQTLPERRQDLVFCGNGLLPPSFYANNSEKNTAAVTQVIPHYAVHQVGVCASVQSTAPPTYLFGKHAKTIQSWLHRDCILNTEILETAAELRIRAAQKILWASCLWLLCHVQRERPLTVGQVYEEHVEILVGLVHELWPAFQSLLLLDADETHDESVSLPTFPETLQYLQDYSLSIPDAVPSLDLAISELRDRNGLLAAPNQPLHRSLLEQVAGPEAAEIVFGSAGSSVDDKDDNNISNAIGSSVTVDLRETAGIAVHGTKTTTNIVGHESFVQRQQNKQKENIVVVGSGILGASVAYHLALLQQQQEPNSNNIPCNITVVSEQTNASDVTPTTRASWAWINANQKEPPAYQQLNCLGMHAWQHHALLHDLPRWCGSLVAQAQTKPASTQHAARTENNNTAGHYAHQEGPLAEEDWRALEPHVEFATATATTKPPMERQQQQKPKGVHGVNGECSGGETASTLRPAIDIAVHYFPNEGCVDPSDAVQRLREAAAELGVRFVWNQNVTRILYDNENEGATVTGIECCELLEDGDKDDSNEENDASIATPQHKMTLEADLVVVAAGTGSTALVGLPMLNSPGGVMTFLQQSPPTSNSQQRHQDESLSKIIVDAVGKSHVLRRRNGSMVAGGGILEFGGRSSLAATKGWTTAQVEDEVIWTGARSLLPHLIGNGDRNAAVSDQQWSKSTAFANRPIPRDGLPAVGFVRPGVYTVVAHSGMTLAPLLGSLAATEILAAVPSSGVGNGKLDLDLLAPYRPTRFLVGDAERGEEKLKIQLPSFLLSFFWDK